MMNPAAGAMCIALLCLSVCATTPREELIRVHRQNLMHFTRDNPRALASAFSDDYVSNRAGSRLDEAHFQRLFERGVFRKYRGLRFEQLVDVDSLLVLDHEEAARRERAGLLQFPTGGKLKPGDYYVYFRARKGSPLYGGFGAVYRREEGVWKIIMSPSEI